MAEKIKLLRVLIVGCGNMGTSHAMAYHNLDGFKFVESFREEIVKRF